MSAGAIGSGAPDLAGLLRAMARNNAWANERLLGACAELTEAEFGAPRVSFFPSLRATLNHSLGVDLYYLDALEGRPAPGGLPDHASPAELRAAQAEADARLVALCDGLAPGDLGREVVTWRDGPYPERLDALLAHLFQHQIHHRGQAHAMLAGTRVAPPQLDEFFLDYDRHPSAAARWAAR